MCPSRSRRTALSCEPCDARTQGPGFAEIQGALKAREGDAGQVASGDVNQHMWQAGHESSDVP